MRALKTFALAMAGLAVGFLIAEGVSAIFLPRPRPQKLPMLRMQADPYCGYRCRPDQKGYTLDARVAVNGLGFRGADISPEKAPGVVRVALLGDSYIFGQGVADDSTLAVKLEGFLNEKIKPGHRYQVLNFGISGYDTGHEVRALEHYGLKFRPDTVVLCFFINDLFFIKDYGFYPAMFEKNEREFSPLKWFLRNIPRSSRILMTLWDLTNARYLRGHEVSDALDAYTRKNADPRTGPVRDGWDFTEARLKDFAELSAKYGFKPVLMVVPSPEEILRGQEAPYAAYLREKAQAMGIQPVELFGDWITSRKDRKDILIPYDFHLSEKGNEEAARELARSLQKMEPSGIR